MSKDKTTIRNNDNNKGRRGNNGNTVLWPLIGGIVIIGSSVLLLILRAIIPSMIIMITGVFLIIYWVYITRGGNKGLGIRSGEKCMCTICNHEQSNMCIQQKCVCCSIAKGDRIVGHTNNPLQ